MKKIPDWEVLEIWSESEHSIESPFKEIHRKENENSKNKLQCF